MVNAIIIKINTVRDDLKLCNNLDHSKIIIAINFIMIKIANSFYLIVILVNFCILHKKQIH